MTIIFSLSIFSLDKKTLQSEFDKKLAKMRSPTICFFVLFVFSAAYQVHASIVKLFDQPHFYELIIENKNSINKLDSFAYTVHGEGNCVKQQVGLKTVSSNIDYLDLNTDTFIYSNFEQTLSFLVQAKFQLKQSIG